jgi:hypothetical protein
MDTLVMSKSIMRMPGKEADISMSGRCDSGGARDAVVQRQARRPSVYEIRVRGHLERQWSDWFDGWQITLEENGDTLLSGPVVDQAALFGLLRKVRDLGAPLISVTLGKPGRTDAADAKP